MQYVANSAKLLDAPSKLRLFCLGAVTFNFAWLAVLASKLRSAACVLGASRGCHSSVSLKPVLSGGLTVDKAGAADPTMAGCSCSLFEATFTV